MLSASVSPDVWDSNEPGSTFKTEMYVGFSVCENMFSPYKM